MATRYKYKYLIIDMRNVIGTIGNDICIPGHGTRDCRKTIKGTPIFSLIFAECKIEDDKYSFREIESLKGTPLSLVSENGGMNWGYKKLFAIVDPEIWKEPGIPGIFQSSIDKEFVTELNVLTKEEAIAEFDRKTELI